MSAERYESPDPHRNVRYGPWRGGPDPLAAPYDVRAAIDQIGSDVMSAGNVRDSLRDLMRRGLDGRGGLDKLAQKLRKLRAAARRRGDLGGTLDQVRAALDQALAAEREALAGAEGDEARMAEMELDTLPDDVAGAVRALDSYEWTSPEAKATYDAIQDMLRREVLDAQFAGMKQALESPDPEAMARVKDMLADLNALLAAHARQEDTTDQFADFMARHGEFFPEQPETVEELIDDLARRQAAAQRMMASLSPEQREQLGQLMSQALGDADLASEMAQLSDNLRSLRPGLDRDSDAGMRPGGASLGYSEAVEAVAELADLEALENQLAQGYSGATLDDVDVDTLEKRLGNEALRDFQGLRDLERELEEQGFLTRTDDGLRLTPRAVRRLGQTALKRVFAQIAAAGHGDHEDHRTGAADEPTGLTRPWEFGDELPIDASRTVANALRRSGLGPSAGAGNTGVTLDVEDFEVTETERRTSAAVALCVDLSYSMFADGRWGPMKQTALALQHLIETRFRQDALQVIGFNRTAQRLSPVELAEIEPTMLQGTNLQHALLIASRHLRRHPDAEPVVLVVTDGEPTAHLTGDGGAYFRWPTTTETLRATIAQVDELGRYGATLNTFMLGDDEGLARFVDAIARRAGGRVFTPDIGRLGEYVVADYLRARRGRR
ncbi:VWA domain-containing protein [uncultured Friedmanniella sp.]|uniref:vWA domain-containing protein n=1 Tax=uncultured Friedmanniella sp. TaxID=335381 RepID=UPI0035C9CBA2